MIYTLLHSDGNKAGSNKKQYEIGDLIDFIQEDSVTPLASEPTPTVVELIHNTNLLDLSSIGLNTDDVALLQTQSTAKKSDLQGQLVIIKAQIEDIKVDIIENQKKINETIKVLDATRQIYGIQLGDISSPVPIYQKLLGIQNGLNAERDALTVAYNNASTQSLTIYNGLLQLSALVR